MSSGEFFVAAELSRLGKIALPTSRNTKGFDVIATNSDFTKTNYIQVKTNKTKYSFWIVNPPLTPAPDRFYVFVNLLDESSKPEYYIVPTQDVWNEYQRMSSLKNINSLTQQEKQVILNEIKQGKAGWQIVYEYGVEIKAVREISKKNSVKIKYDRGKGEDFPFSFTIEKSQEHLYRDKWDLLTI